MDVMEINNINAPVITAKQLWGLTPDDFNSWRREHDYPRIIAFLKENMACFQEWIEEQNITDGEFLEFGPAVFLKEDKNIKIYDLESADGLATREIRPSEHSIGETIFHQKKVIDKKIVIPYFEWAKSSKQCIENRVREEFSINSRRGRSAFIFRKLELVDAGNIKLPKNYQLGGRDLELLNLDDLILEEPLNNTNLKLWYSSAINLTVIGDLAFIDAYKTPFTEVMATRTRSMKLVTGSFQSWRFKDCEVNFKSTNSSIHLWEVEGNQFQCTLEHSDLKDCHFKEGSSKLATAYKGASQFHRTIKRIYSQIGDHSKAGEHFYKEKSFEQKSLMDPKHHNRKEIQEEKNFLRKGFIYLFSYIRFLKLAFQNLLWGFGEKPGRVFGWAVFVIIGSALIYNYHPCSATYSDEINSIYFSLVTFTTLGYGEITQNDTFLKVYASIEALLGLTIMALVVAGFSSKSKDY
jgi:hypothetical protein